MSDDPRDTGDFAIDIARRLQVTRRALEYNTQAEFAAAAGIGRTNYTQAESGSRVLSLNMALQLYDAFGITLDWLYRGDRSGLRAKLRDNIRAIERGDAD